MDFESITIAIIAGLFILIGTNIIYFIEASAITEFFFKMLFPKRTTKEIEDNRRIRRNIKYKRHKRKWGLLYILNYPVFFVALFIFILLFKDVRLSYFGALFVFLISTEKFDRKEIAAKNIVIKEINSEYNSENHKSNLLE